MTNIDLSKPTRQELRGFVVVFLFEAQKAIRAFWPMLIFIFAQKKLLPEGVTIPMALGFLLLLVLVHAILYFVNFYFYVEGDQFVLKKGYLNRKVLSVPLERIQSVNTKQNLLQQLFRVYSLELDTAGSVGKELKIYSLSESYAAYLTWFLQSQKGEGIESEDKATPDDLLKEDLIIKLTPSDLMRIGISRNHLRTGLIIFAFGSQIVGQIQDLFQEQAEVYSESFDRFMAGTSIVFFFFLLILFLAISILASLVLTVIKYYDFKLVKEQGSYRITAGLLSKRKVLLPFNKIQQLNWETGPIKKIFGIFRISFKQAVSKQTNQMKVADAPGCFNNHVEQVRREVFNDDLPDGVGKIYSHRRYFVVLWMYAGVLPVLLFTVLFIYKPIWIIGGAVYLVLSALYCTMAARKRYFQFNGTQLLVGKGAINTEWQQVEAYKTQTVDFRQSFFQRRRGLASLRINNASGSINIPYISEDMARLLMNYLLYHVESSNKAWM